MNLQVSPRLGHGPLPREAVPEEDGPAPSGAGGGGGGGVRV